MKERLWALVITVDGVKSYDVHADAARVHVILSGWLRQPREIGFFITPCPCDRCGGIPQKSAPAPTEQAGSGS